MRGGRRSISWQLPASHLVMDLRSGSFLTSKGVPHLGGAMVYDEDPRPPMHYGIRGEEPSDVEVPMEPPQNDAIRQLIVRLVTKYPGLPAERIYEHIRTVINRHDVPLAAVNYVFAELQAVPQTSHQAAPQTSHHGGPTDSGTNVQQRTTGAPSSQNPPTAPRRGPSVAG
jgi:hypothetical protein